jgi:hypothetical protein
MISENSIKTKFVIDTLKKGVDITFKRELEGFDARLKSKTGSTKSALSSPNYILTASGEQFRVMAFVTKQLRFQDMGVRKLYTKPLFSVLNRTYDILRSGITDEIRKTIRKELESANLQSKI